MRTGVFRSLASFNYRVWAAGALVSNIGTWMQRAAQDWLVLTQLTNHSASAVGIVMALQFGPQLLLMPWSGLAADRFNQRQAPDGHPGDDGHAVPRSWASSPSPALVAALACLCLRVSVRVQRRAFDAPVRQTFVAELVGDETCRTPSRSNSTSFNAARMVGPAMAGLTIASVGTGWAFLFNGASFMAVLTSLCLLRNSELRPNARAPRTRGRHHRRIPLCVVPPGSQGDPGHAVPDRDLRPELSDLHLDHGGRRLPYRRARLRPAVIDDGDRHDVGRAAGGDGATSRASPR